MIPISDHAARVLAWRTSLPSGSEINLFALQSVHIHTVCTRRLSRCDDWTGISELYVFDQSGVQLATRRLSAAIVRFGSCHKISEETLHIPHCTLSGYRHDKFMKSMRAWLLMRLLSFHHLTT